MRQVTFGLEDVIPFSLERGVCCVLLHLCDNPDVVIPLHTSDQQARDIYLTLVDGVTPIPFWQDVFVRMEYVFGVAVKKVLFQPYDKKVLCAVVTFERGEKKEEFQIQAWEGIILALHAKVPMYVSDELAEFALQNTGKGEAETALAELSSKTRAFINALNFDGI